MRAPTLFNLYRPPSQTFLNGLIDPCSQANINNGSASRAANCAAAGVPTTEIVNGTSTPWTNLPASGIRGLQGSNPNLNEEVGTSLTIGAVFQPRFIPGLTFTVDYYDITVDNVILTLAAQTIIDLCYDSSTGINNQYCAAISRRPDGTFLGQSNRNVGGTTVQYTVGANDSSFLAGPFNFAKLKTSGSPQSAAGARITPNLLGLLGVRPLPGGRGFSEGAPMSRANASTSARSVRVPSPTVCGSRLRYEKSGRPSSTNTRCSGALM